MILGAAGYAAGYGGEPLIRGLEFEVGEGGIAVLVGPNAAGKSTILRALLRHAGARGQGDLRWMGVRVSDLRAPPVPPGAIAWLRQERPVFEGFTVEETLAVTQPGRTRAERRRGRDRVLELLPELRPWLARRIDALSGGERALACLGAALAAEPRLLLLDEPAANLDEARAARMCAAVRADVTVRGAGALVIEHRPEAVKALGGVVVEVAGQSSRESARALR